MRVLMVSDVYFPRVNGVSTSMLIDYGDFAVRGELKELTYYKKSDCVVQDDGAAGR